jgi:hypothetical protein
MAEAEDPRGLVERLVSSEDVLRYLWMCYSDPMVCPVERWRWCELHRGDDDRRDPEFKALIIDQRRW